MPVWMTYDAPVGKLFLRAEGNALTGLWIEGQKHFPREMPESISDSPGLPVLEQAKEWLNRYFAGEKPSPEELKLQPVGSDFQLQVWEILRRIPYGQVLTYGEIAREIARQRGNNTMSAQAVGGAVGHNPISILIPCHRVIGSDGCMTGYDAGVDKKRYLLCLEGVITI